MKVHLINYCNNLVTKLGLFILLILMISGCFSIKPSTTNSGKKYFETFYVGEAGTQYFIKPFLFKNDKSDEDLIVDITFRYRNEIRDSAIVNFSIKSSIMYKTIDSIKLSNNDIEIKTSKVELLFNETSKTGFTSRHSTKFSLKEVKDLFNNDVWEMSIYNQNIIGTYKPYRKTIRSINVLKDKVFVLM